jgi:hypothetical protein
LDENNNAQFEPLNLEVRPDDLYEPISPLIPEEIAQSRPAEAVHSGYQVAQVCVSCHEAMDTTDYPHGIPEVRTPLRFGYILLN